jgi:hypothetical protein
VFESAKGPLRRCQTDIYGLSLHRRYCKAPPKVPRHPQPAIGLHEQRRHLDFSKAARANDDAISTLHHRSGVTWSRRMYLPMRRKGTSHRQRCSGEDKIRELAALCVLFPACCLVPGCHPLQNGDRVLGVHTHLWMLPWMWACQFRAAAAMCWGMGNERKVLASDQNKTRPRKKKKSPGETMTCSAVESVSWNQTQTARGQSS